MLSKCHQEYNCLKIDGVVSSDLKHSTHETLFKHEPKQQPHLQRKAKIENPPTQHTGFSEFN